MGFMNPCACLKLVKLDRFFFFSLGFAFIEASLVTSISLASGVIAGVASAIISHPADTLLSKINKKGAGGTGSTASRLMNIAKETGFVKLATTGLGARCVMIGTLTAGQFGVFDVVMNAVGAKKFHFHDPSHH
jgi:solute carrier family 25 phosphate transporter 3